MASRLLDQSLADVRRQRQSSGARTAPKERAASDQDTWKHDKFEGRRARPSRNAPHGEQDVIATRVAIEGLHYEVSEAELKDLFSQIGPIAQGPTITFDASGRSTGNASVWYASEADAQTAVVEFDGAKAKGEPIQVKVLGTSRIARGGRAARGRGARTPSLMDRMQGAPASRGHARPEKRRGAQRKERRSPASAASLDAELDAFMNAPPETDNGEAAMED
ncbi:uncharacterized protein MJAP1_001384 [Malassezia japonica]|uniref:RRM domain-containing protein n=1 Tax=Malassezia japonica TaxID=223818 RepID=A0AAF0JEZ0_9BASI|nr:uncharacterized protein MJAP1_001384 [Malassezia japonica]WFD38431.1 hypothetical protein MJAP1_001384 [Malassezia japonica]